MFVHFFLWRMIRPSPTQCPYGRLVTARKLDDQDMDFEGHSAQSLPYSGGGDAFYPSLSQLKSVIEPKTPIYLLIRRSGCGLSSLVAVTYIPSNAGVRAKTHLTLTGLRYVSRPQWLRIAWKSQITGEQFRVIDAEGETAE
ncbi:hypothetical protein BJX99DRAFT_200764 [Aspergillus californicus]